MLPPENANYLEFLNRVSAKIPQRLYPNKASQATLIPLGNIKKHTATHIISWAFCFKTQEFQKFLQKRPYLGTNFQKEYTFKDINIILTSRA